MTKKEIQVVTDRIVAKVQQKPYEYSDEERRCTLVVIQREMEKARTNREVIQILANVYELNYIDAEYMRGLLWKFDKDAPEMPHDLLIRE